MLINAIRVGKDVKVSIASEKSFHPYFLSNVEHLPFIVAARCPKSDYRSVSGDKRALFCDLVANLVPVEDAKAIAGIH